MPEKILVLDNSTFFVICRAAEDEKDMRNAQNLHWFLLDDKKCSKPGDSFRPHV